MSRARDFDFDNPRCITGLRFLPTTASGCRTVLRSMAAARYVVGKIAFDVTISMGAARGFAISAIPRPEMGGTSRNGFLSAIFNELQNLCRPLSVEGSPNVDE